MIYSVQQIKFEVLAYIKEFGADFQQWFIGIASHPKQALCEHQVDENQDIWLCKRAISHRACQTIYDYFTETLKLDGSMGELGDPDGNYIYLFRKSGRTLPKAANLPSLQALQTGRSAHCD